MPHTYQLISEQWVPQPLEEAFAFFSQPENLQEITPGWLDFRIVRVDSNAPGVLRAGHDVEAIFEFRRQRLEVLLGTH